MALRLRIVSDHRRALGKRASIVFGVTGGNIGRSADNDWVLPDPSRFVSARHARIKFNDGRFFIEDTSTNGTYVNDSDQPLPKAAPQELNNGDMIRFGEYHVVVALDADADFTAGPSAMVNLDSSLSDGAQIPQFLGSLDASLSASALFAPEDLASLPARASQAFGHSVLMENSQSQAMPGQAAPKAAHSTGDSDIVAARRLERLARAVREKDSHAQTQDARAGLEAFCRGVGIETNTLPDGHAAAILQIAGRLLREALISLKDLDAKQGEFRRQFRLPRVRDDETQPFKLAGSTDDLLAALFASHESRRLDAGQWLRACFEQQASHHDALARGSRAGFVEFLRQLSPAELERRFATTAKRGVAGPKPNNWELYAEFHRSASEAQPDTGVPSLYAETLANAYNAALKKGTG